MTNSEIFTLAHKLTKENKKENDNYSVIFGCYVKMIKSGEIKVNEEKQETAGNSNYDDEIYFIMIVLMAITTILAGVFGIAGTLEEFFGVAIFSGVPNMLLAAVIRKWIDKRNK